jgi:pyruvate formate lyase activating enzyme
MINDPFDAPIDRLTKTGTFFEKVDSSTVRCYACAHRCLIHDGKRGICNVRFNKGGVLYVPWGYVAGLNPDPIEKKPFFHVLPSAIALTFGMLGCDFHCDFCQNWFSSQVLRDTLCDTAQYRIQQLSPEQIVQTARRYGARVIASSYNEPLITSEWAIDIFQLAVQEGIRCVYVSNGNATPEVLSALKPYLTAIKIDLKTMQDRQYRQLGGVLENILNGIQLAYRLGFWVEIVTLIIPNYNDSDAELKDIAQFIASLSADIPWHVTAFHPDYKRTSSPPTPASTLLRAVKIGEEAGLHYVYAGNLPGRTGGYENTPVLLATLQ